MKLIVTEAFMDQAWLDRVNGVVCVNGTKLVKISTESAQLETSTGRTTLNQYELSTFVQNFVAEGFESKITIF
jgi:hypothetical protein